MNEDEDFVRLWAMHQKGLREAREQYMKANGLTWDTLKDIKEKAAAQMTSEILETEYGTIKRVATPIWLHKNSEKIGENVELHFTRR